MSILPFNLSVCSVMFDIFANFDVQILDVFNLSLVFATQEFEQSFEYHSFYCMKVG